MELVNKSLVINIQLSRMFIVQRLSESIAENMRRQYNYEVYNYVSISKSFLLELGMEEEYVKELIKDVVDEAYTLHRQYRMTGLYTYHNGSGAHPGILVYKEAQDLVTMLRILTEAYARDLSNRKAVAQLN